MELHDIALGRIIKLNDDTAEVIASEGVEIDIPMVDEYHDWIDRNLPDKAFMLINRVNSYSYTYDAEKVIGTQPKIRATAILVYSRVSEITAEYMTSFPRAIAWNARIFNSREEALGWIDSQR